MRLIDADALKKAVYAAFGNSNLTDAFNDIIDNAPTVDPKEIKPLVDKVVDVVPELTDLIIKELPNIVNGAIKCSECSYYKNTFDYIPRPQGEWKLDSVGVYCSECKKHPDYSSDF
jgi:hypothetical protein